VFQVFSFRNSPCHVAKYPFWTYTGVVISVHHAGSSSYTIAIARDEGGGFHKFDGVFYSANERDQYVKNDNSDPRHVQWTRMECQLCRRMQQASWRRRGKTFPTASALNECYGDARKNLNHVRRQVPFQAKTADAELFDCCQKSKPKHPVYHGYFNA
jgi:hypothetical protein